jgi:glycosyltransferase involved in cell wall biosynthesis
MSDVLFSIIIPHRNSPELLQRCLFSIPDDPSIQVIIIDDASDEEFVDFDLFPGKDRTNVFSYFNKKNEGAGSARNLGLHYSLGKWIIFADADDFFVPNAFLVFSDNVCDSSDIVYFGVKSIYSDTFETADRESSYSFMVNLFNCDDKQSEFRLRFRHIVPWGKMFKRSFVFVNKLVFEEIRASNDVMFNVRAGSLAKLISVDPRIVYCVTVNKGSLTNTVNREVSMSRFLAKLRYNDYVKSLGKGEYQYSMRNEMFIALSFGIKEFLVYFKLAISHNTNFFADLNLIRFFKKIKSLIRKNQYVVKH